MKMSAIRRMAADNLGVDEASVGPETRLWRAVDAVSMAKLIILYERRFGIHIDDERVSGFRRVRDLESYVAHCLSEGQGVRAPSSDRDRTAWYYE